MKVTLKHMKKAIVLLMTIGFIALISALVLISLSISKRSFDEVVYLDARNQFSVVFKDFVTMLRTNSDKVKTADELEVLLGLFLPAMKEPKTGIEFGFDIESKMGKLNTNYLLHQMVLDVDDVNQTILERPFLNYFSNFDINNKKLLLDIMEDTVDTDDFESGAYSEIASEDFDFRQGKIYSYNHLKKIFEHYYKISLDKNIFKIDRDSWEEVFYFGDTNSSSQLLDCNQLDMTPVINLITDNRYANPAELDFCQMLKDKDEVLLELKDIYNISDFNKTNQYLIQCTIIFNTENFNRNVRFDYDLKTGKVDNIDKNFQE